MKPIDEFAKAALTGLLQNSASPFFNMQDIEERTYISKLAYDIAEAMEAERVKREPRSNWHPGELPC